MDYRKIFPRYVAGLFLAILTMTIFGCGSGGKETKDHAYTVVDARGDTVKIPHKPQRILSFVPMTDEMLLGLVEPERMVAVCEDLADPVRSNLAAAANKVSKKIPRNPSVEIAAGMKPDLCIANSTWVPVEKVDTLRSLGIPVVVINPPGKYEEVLATLRIIAKAVDEPERGEKLIKNMESKLAEIKTKIDKQPSDRRNRTIALISIMPGYGGAGSIFDDTCRLAGAQNAKALYGNKHGHAMTKEQLVECNPDFLFIPSYGDPNSRGEKFGREFLEDPSLQAMKAIKNGRICGPASRYIYNLSQNFVFGVQETAYFLYGDEFKLGMDGHLSAVE